MPVPDLVQDRGRIGVFGGTFDPPHVGHLVAAVDVAHALRLDVVLFVVAGDPWQKSSQRPLTPAEDRLALVEAAVASAPRFEASDLEVRRPGPSYTADTLAQLAGRHPGAELFLVLGADAAAGLDSWERVEEVRAGARLVVVERPGHEAGPPPGWDAEVVRIPLLDVSSSDVRDRLAEGRPVDYLLTRPVMRAIADRALYRT